ncbi:hypothetical protein, partial [uncultured Vibrio sp.]|uniref:hypothetical protein n=1 Tax=uncultured Vibrio sp. TaxID=114054 RepID=UPI002614EF50
CSSPKGESPYILGGRHLVTGVAYPTEAILAAQGAVCTARSGFTIKGVRSCMSQYTRFDRLPKTVLLYHFLALQIGQLISTVLDRIIFIQLT